MDPCWNSCQGCDNDRTCYPAVYSGRVSDTVTVAAHDKVLQKGGCNRAVRTMTGKAAMLIKQCVLCCQSDHTKSIVMDQLSWDATLEIR